MQTITIVGVGALGSHVALLLRNEAQLKVIDFDRIERKNVLSQFHAKASVGKNKAEALKQSMSFLFDTKVEAIPHKLTRDNRVQLLGDEKSTDLIIDCLDNGESRRLIQGYVQHDHDGLTAFGLPLLHGALAGGAGFGRVIWDEQFVIDDEDGAGAATCEGGEFLPFIAIVASYIAYAAQQYLKDGTKVGYQVHPGGVARI
jgi:molybdopterin/thiamine biosynthesis adenylyltransferase